MTCSQVVFTMVSTRSRAALCALLGLCLLAGLTSRAGAVSASPLVVTRTADDTLPGSLRYAISQAAGTGGTVTFAIPNTDPGYSSAANADTITLSLGQLNVPGSLTIAAPAAPSTTVAISGNNASRVFSVTGGTVAFSNLTITKGVTQSSGGGDLLNAATLTLTACTVTGGIAVGSSQIQGGDILNTGALTLTGCTVSGGVTYGGDGGGINNNGSGASLILTGCTVSGNTTQFGGNGGGVANGGTLTATGSLIKGNSANNQGAGGGGGLANTGVATLNACTLSGNGVSGANGGGGGGGAFNTGSLTLNNCLVDSNNGTGSSFGGGNGAGIYSSGGTLTLSACTLSNNVGQSGGNGHAGGVGGGIVCFGTTQLTDCLVVNNSGNLVGGMDNGGVLSIINSTFADNSSPPPFGPPNSPPTIGGLLSGPATLLNDIFYFDTGSANNTAVVSEIVAASGTTGPTVTFSDVQGGYPGTGNLSADPRFVRNPYTISATDTGDEHLRLTSPAVHTGTNGPGVPLTDIEGTPRPTPPATPSMGAYEVPGSASGFSVQGGFLVTGMQNVSTGSQVVAKFLPGSTPAAGFTASVNLGDGNVVLGAIVPDPTTAGVFDVTVSHVYTAYGTFPIAVTVSGPNNVPTATVNSTANILPAQIATDVTSQVSVFRGGFYFNRFTKRYSQTVTIKNTGTAAIAGPLSLALDNLTAGAAAIGAAGTTQYAPGPAGSPYFTVQSGSLAPGATTSVFLQLTNTGSSQIDYTPRVLAGPGTR